VSEIGLETLGVKTDKGYIVIDDAMRTNVEHVYAIGDVTGKQQLAHTAMHMGVVAVERSPACTRTRWTTPRFPGSPIAIRRSARSG
jgi:pyruvate/2-oxoglutarate dehydrogenase complex dihydrolipoamide dehydrogenase (E3) component